MNTGAMLELLWAVSGTARKASLQPRDGWRFDEATGTLVVYPWFKGGYQGGSSAGPYWVDADFYPYTDSTHSTVYRPWDAQAGKIRRVIFQAEWLPGASFLNCAALEDVHILEGCSRIGMGAFENCTNLKKIQLPTSCKHLAGRVFAGCGALEAVQGFGVEDLQGNLQFCDCHRLKDVQLPLLQIVSERMFDGCGALQTVRLDSVKWLETQAFINSGLKSIRLPALEGGGGYWFSYCSELADVTLPQDSEFNVEACFYGCTKLKSVRGGLVYGKAAYKGCASLQALDNYKLGYEEQFYGCAGLVRLGNEERFNLTNIGKKELDECRAFEVWHDYTGKRPRVKHIEYLHKDMGFYISDEGDAPVHFALYSGKPAMIGRLLAGDINCYEFSAEESYETRYTAVTYTGDYYADPNGFYDTPCSGWNIKENRLYLYINLDPFAGTPWNENKAEIQKIRLEQGVSTVPDNAFAELYTLLGEVMIPRSVQRIGENAFAGQERLPLVLYEGSAEEWAAMDVAPGNQALRNAQRIVYNWDFNNGYDLFTKTLTINGFSLQRDFERGERKSWSDFDKDCFTVNVITPGKFREGTAGKPETWWTGGIARVPHWAFAGCGASQINLPGESSGLYGSVAQQRIEEVGDHAFDGCVNLTRVTGIDRNVTNRFFLKICGDYAFRGCGFSDAGLAIWESDDGTVYSQKYNYGFGIFAGCKNLIAGEAVLRVGSQESWIPSGIYQNCPRLMNPGLGTGLGVIGSQAFEGCTSLTSLTLPKDLEMVEYRAFADTGITALNLSDSGYKTIAGEGFANCAFLSTIVLNAITTVNQTAFLGCNLAMVMFQGTMGSFEAYTQSGRINDYNVTFGGAIIMCTDGIYGVDNVEGATNEVE